MCRVLLACVVVLGLRAQQTPSELAHLFVQQFSGGTAEEFARVFPLPAGRDSLRRAVEWKVARKGAYAKVLEQQNDRAVLLLGGYPAIPNSGDETGFAQGFSGMYEAVREGGVWRLKSQIPIDAGNRILAHKLDVTLEPGSGLRVTDHMRVEVGGTHGFTAALNHSAQIARILWNDRPVDYAFGGGVIWLPLRKGGVVTLDYEILVEKGPNNTNSSCFLEHAGHVRNQYYWHPFFGFFNGRDISEFEITVRLPAAYRVATSIPQSDRVEGNIRMVMGHTIRNTEALSLLYDRDWKPVIAQAGEMRLELFTTPDFEPRHQQITTTFGETYEMLRRRFGAPAGGYVSVVQSRARGDSGWRYSSNQAIVGGTKGAPLEGPDATNFFHEMAHSWTQGLGPAANLLQEGWATYAESVYLREKVGQEGVKRFWKTQADIYFASFEGKATLLDDSHNQGIAYRKGSWVFLMLEHVIGETSFNRAMAEFSRRSVQHPGDVELLLQCFQQASGRDLTGFLMPWLKEATAPRLETRIAGSGVVITQLGPLFDLPLDIAVETETGIQRKQIRIWQRETSVNAESAVKGVVIDPDGRFLLSRR